jgi:hypothetical protein
MRLIVSFLLAAVMLIGFTATAFSSEKPDLLIVTRDINALPLYEGKYYDMLAVEVIPTFLASKTFDRVGVLPSSEAPRGMAEESVYINMAKKEGYDAVMLISIGSSDDDVKVYSQERLVPQKLHNATFKLYAVEQGKLVDYKSIGEDLPEIFRERLNRYSKQLSKKFPLK